MPKPPLPEAAVAMLRKPGSSPTATHQDDPALVGDLVPVPLGVPRQGGRVWLVGEVSGQLAGRGGAGRDPAVRLPPRRSTFVGRTAELGEIAATLGRHTVVTLTGVGGVGKTALAVEAAWIEVSAGRAVMACYIDLVPCRTDEQVVAALVEGVGIRGAAAGL